MSPPPDFTDLRRRLRAGTANVAPPVDESVLLAIESHGFSLPADYRAFVTTVTGEIEDSFVDPRRATRHLVDPQGAFPGLKERGLTPDVRNFGFAPEDAARAIAAARGHLKEGLPPGPGRSYLDPVADSTFGGMVFRDNYPVEEVWLRGNEWHEGTLVLEDQGCGWQVNLVLAGPLGGTVWHSGDHGWLPHFYVDAAGESRAHDFVSWLGVQMALLGAG